jgi:dATP/dGTP diphosphohydrolase
MSFVTKDSGKRAEFESGMVRDTQEGKPRFDLLLPEGVPYADQFLTRFAMLMARGASKYEDRNWEKASGEAELARFLSSLLRHTIAYVCGETDEDHGAAICFNVMGAETTKYKMRGNE